MHKAQKTLRQGLQYLIKFYQVAHLPFYRNVCRHYPSCSHYAIEALEVHGIVKGTGMSLLRIAKCNPFFKGGFDPVPPAKSSKENQPL